MYTFLKIWVFESNKHTWISHCLSDVPSWKWWNRVRPCRSRKRGLISCWRWRQRWRRSWTQSAQTSRAKRRRAERTNNNSAPSDRAWISCLTGRERWGRAPYGSHLLRPALLCLRLAYLSSCLNQRVPYTSCLYLLLPVFCAHLLFPSYLVTLI